MPEIIGLLKNPEIQRSQNPQIQKFKDPQIQKSKTPKIKKSKDWNMEVFSQKQLM